MPEQKRILVVDDSEENRLFVTEILEENGYDHCVAQNGLEALALMRKETVDLVLLDLMMPRKSGVFVLSEMEKDPALQHIPVIVITGATEATGVDMQTGEVEPVKTFTDQHPRAVGARLHKKLSRNTPNALIEKPLDPPVLVAKIQELLRPEQVWTGGGI